MNIVLVYNPKSGSALTADELHAACRKHGITLDALIGIDETLGKRLEPFIEEGATIGVIGGDGTLSAVAGFVSGSKAVFAPLPGGTLNHFTKDLGISQDIDKALADLAMSKVRTIDVGTVNKTVFINNSSIGLYPSSLRVRNRLVDCLGKWPATLMASLRTIVRFRTYEVTIGGETFHTPFVFVGNNEYIINGVSGVSRGALNGGTLSVFIARTVSRWKLLKIVLWALIGRVRQLDEFEVRTTTSLQIATKRRYLSVSRDGEVDHFTSPLQYNIHPRALKVRY